MSEKPSYEELEQRVKDLELELLTRERSLTMEPSIDINTLINADEIQAIMDNFCSLTHMVTAIVDLNGNVIESTGWQDICSKFHRIHPQTAENCTKSDLFLAQNLKQGEFVHYKCKNGLWDVVTPLYVGDRHLANIYTGQFFYDDESIDEGFFIRQAKTYGFDPVAYLAAFHKIPRYSRETISNLMHFLVKFTSYISRVSVVNLQLETQIQERKNIQKELTENKDRYRSLIHQMSAGFALHEIICDTAGNPVDYRFIETNDAFETVTGLKQKAIIGKTVMEVLPQTEKYWVQKFCDVALTREPLQYSNYSRELDKYYDVIAYSPKKGQFATIISDITDRKKTEDERMKLENQLRQIQKMEAVGLLAGGVAHEINNPINGIMNYAQLIKDKAPEESDEKNFSSEIIIETERVAKIVRNLLTFACQKKEYHSPARMIDIINNTMTLIQAMLLRDQINLKIDIPEGLPTVNCRSQQIQQVLMNLITNSLDALNVKFPDYDKNKVIKIGSALIKKGERSWVRTTVEDFGIGISQDIIENIFDPFFSTKPKESGTGLGLSISYGIVKDHHGELTLESKPGEYTKFNVDLPVDNRLGIPTQ